MQTVYETILSVVKPLKQPFKRVDIIRALHRSGHDNFTNASVAGWINRARAKHDILLGDGPGDYLVAGRGMPIPKPARRVTVTKSERHRTDGYSTAAMIKLRLLALSGDFGDMELIGGLGVG